VSPVARTPSSSVDTTAEQLKTQFKRAIPKNEAIVRQALQETLSRYLGDVEAMKGDLSRIIVESENVAHRIYLDAQKVAQVGALKSVLGYMVKDEPSISAAVDCISSHAAALDQFYLSVAQGRKARAGAALEIFFETIFSALGFHYEREHVVNGTPDFVFPSDAHFRVLPTDCIVFTCKRTLRERWRQITTEGSRGFLLFLGTVDATVKLNDLEEIRTQKINLVVPESVRSAAYTNAPHVISIERFVRDHLDPAHDRWRRNGVIPASPNL